MDMTLHDSELDLQGEPQIIAERIVHDLEVTIDAIGDNLPNICDGEINRIVEASRRLFAFAAYLRARTSVAA